MAHYLLEFMWPILFLGQQIQHKLDVLKAAVAQDKVPLFLKYFFPLMCPEVIPYRFLPSNHLYEAVSSMIPTFLPRRLRPILFSSSASQGNHTASSQYSSDSNSCASWRKQNIRHMKWQGIGLAGYFCTLLIRKTCIVYTRVFPIEQRGERGRTENQMSERIYYKWNLFENQCVIVSFPCLS